jgi:hypothetical protein
MSEISGYTRPSMPTAADRIRSEQQMVRAGLAEEDFGGVGDGKIKDWMKAEVGDEIADLMGIPDISWNLLVQVGVEVSTPGLYGLGAPTLSHEKEPQGGGIVATTMEDAGYWSRMQWIEYLSATMGDAIVCLECDEEGFSVRTVATYDVYVVCAPHNQSVIWELGELRVRVVDGKECFCWDRYRLPIPGVQGREVADFAVMKPNAMFDGGMEDVTDRCGVSREWKWTYDTGKPYIPYVFYSRMDTGKVWHSSHRRGTTRATFKLITMGTFAGRCFTDASHNTGLAINVVLPGASEVATPEATGTVPVQVMKTTPGTIIATRSIQDQQPAYYPIGAGANLNMLQTFLESYINNALRREGIHTESSSGPNPQSAGALQISAQEKRRIADRVRPMFARRDREAIAKTAALLRYHGHPSGPERGYTLEYKQIPATPEERQADRDNLTWMHEQKIVNRVDIYLGEHPGVDRKTAIRRLKALDKEEAEIAAAAPETEEPEPAEVETEVADAGETATEPE